ncbi:MAG: methylamine utilization protein [Burkholderiaceae bacterium]
MPLRRSVPPLAACVLALLLAAGGAARAAAVQVQVTGAAGQPLSDAVVMFEPVAGAARPVPRPATQVEIAQQGRRFVPLVTVVPVGTKVQFPNQDTVRHHVYSFSPAKKFELKLYVGKPESPVEFDKPGIVVLGCNIHDTMVGWVVVADTPWFAKTQAGGHATLADLPPGAYTLRAWHPDLPAGVPATEQAVTVGAGAAEFTARVNVAAR